MSDDFYSLFKQFRNDETKLLKIALDSIKLGGTFNKENSEGELPLHLACSEGYSQLALLLLDVTESIDKPSHLGITPLHYAASRGLVDVCQRLVARGANVDAKTQDGLTPWYLAFEYSSESMAVYLVQLSHNILQPLGDFNRTIFHLAAIKGYEKLIEALLNYGVPIDLCDSQGYTALQLAVRENHFKLVEILIKRGASLYHLNQNGLSVSSIAAQNYPMLRLLQKLGASFITDDQFPAEVNLPLPVFRYYPNPMATGGLLFDELGCLCDACEKLVHFFCDIGEGLVCPWCIAKGGVNRKYKIDINDVDFESKIPTAIKKEIEQRTPPLLTWQQPYWRTCCNDACAFLCKGGLAELTSFDETVVEVVKKQVIDEFKLSNEDAKAYLQELCLEGPTVYLFQCLSCYGYKSYIDAP